jgi:hypothetical protein
VTPRFRPYAGECGSPLAFVVSKNLHRRHLTESQRALVAARLKPLFEEEARQRQVAALQRKTELLVPPNLEERGQRQAKGESAESAAALMNVSRSSVWAAESVKKHGVPQLVDALAAGKVSVSAAARIAKLPVEQQEAVVRAIAGGLKPKQALAQVLGTSANDQAAMVDDDGKSLPEGVMLAFRQREQLRALCRRIEALGQEVQHLASAPVGVHLDVQQVLTSLETARRALLAGEPSRLCPHGPDDEPHCHACRGHGWLPAGLRESSGSVQLTDHEPAPMGNGETPGTGQG